MQFLHSQHKRSRVVGSITVAVAMMAAKVAVVSEAREGEQGVSEAAPGGGLFVVWSHGLTNCTMYTVQAVSGNRTHSQQDKDIRHPMQWDYLEPAYRTCVPLRSPAVIGRPRRLFPCHLTRRPLMKANCRSIDDDLLSWENSQFFQDKRCLPVPTTIAIIIMCSVPKMQPPLRVSE